MTMPEMPIDFQGTPDRTGWPPSPRLEMLSFCVLFQLFVENDRHLTRLTAGHKRIRFVRFLKRKSVCNEVFRMNLPAHNPLHEVLHEPNARYPGSVDGLLVMNHVRTRTKSQRSTLSNECYLAPLARRLDRRKTALVAAARIKRPFNPISTR